MQTDLFAPDIAVERTAGLMAAQAASDRADRAHKGWHARAVAFFVDYLATKTDAFMTEDVRQAAHAAGLPEPPDGRAWGAVTATMADKRLIKRIGYGPQKSAGCHAAPKSIWVRGNLRNLKAYAEAVARPKLVEGLH